MISPVRFDYGRCSSLRCLRTRREVVEADLLRQGYLQMQGTQGVAGAYYLLTFDFRPVSQPDSIVLKLLVSRPGIEPGTY